MALEEGWPCNGPLLRLAVSAAERLLPGKTALVLRYSYICCHEVCTSSIFGWLCNGRCFELKRLDYSTPPIGTASCTCDDNITVVEQFKSFPDTYSPASIYLFKANNRNTGTVWNSEVFIANFEKVSSIVLVFPFVFEKVNTAWVRIRVYTKSTFTALKYLFIGCRPLRHSFLGHHGIRKQTLF